MSVLYLINFLVSELTAVIILLTKWPKNRIHHRQYVCMVVSWPPVPEKWGWICWIVSFVKQVHFCNKSTPFQRVRLHTVQTWRILGSTVQTKYYRLQPRKECIFWWISKNAMDPMKNWVVANFIIINPTWHFADSTLVDFFSICVDFEIFYMVLYRKFCISFDRWSLLVYPGLLMDDGCNITTSSGKTVWRIDFAPGRKVSEVVSQ